MIRKFTILGLFLFVQCSLSFAAEELSTLKDVHSALYGNDLKQPSADSWLGKYLKATKAATVWKRFLKAPPGSVVPASEFGAPRLVISVSRATFAEFQKNFVNKNMLYQIHYPQAGSLNYGHTGYKENILQRDAAFFFGNYPTNTLLIPVVLKESEANRASVYFSMMGTTLRAFLTQPWLLTSRSGKSYMPENIFNGCTHWFGDMPIGDKIVSTYELPSGDVDGSHPATQKIVAFDRTNLIAQLKAYGMPPDEKDLKNIETLKKVWSSPGHQMLGEMIDPLAHRRGEYANPGWLAHSLLGSASVQRVPIAFRLVDDARAMVSADSIPFQTAPH